VHLFLWLLPSLLKDCPSVIIPEVKTSVPKLASIHIFVLHEHSQLHGKMHNADDGL
jgi:hypothetical protein